MAKHFQIDTAGTLNTNLVSYWKLEDETDYFGSNGLTNNGSTAFVSAKVNNGAEGNASSKYLSKSSPSGLPTGSTSRSLSLWIKRASGRSAAVGTEAAFDYGTASNGQGFTFYTYRYQEFGLDYYGNAAFLSSGGTLVAGTWYHFIATYDSVANEIKVYKNNSLVITHTPTFTINTGTAAGLNILRQATVAAGYTADIVDEVGIWSKVLSSTERADLYNGGNGQTMIDTSSIGVSDAGTASDAKAIAARFTASESGSGADAKAIAARLTAADSGSGADASPQTQATVPVGETIRQITTF